MDIYVGIVENNIDPKRLGRLKVRVLGVFDDLKKEDLPWSSPFNTIDGRSFSLPSIGKLVSIIFVKNDIYMPYYINSENYNINLKIRLDNMEDDNYSNFTALLYDHRTQVYSDDDEFKIDYYFNNFSIDHDGINLDLKNNNQKINLGSKDKSTQQALFGNHWLNWFDKFVNKLLIPSSLYVPPNETGISVLKPEIDELLLEYKQIRSTFISNNVYIVDNHKIQDIDIDLDESNNINTDNYFNYLKK
jgi:hypothetical protein